VLPVVGGESQSSHPVFGILAQGGDELVQCLVKVGAVGGNRGSRQKYRPPSGLSDRFGLPQPPAAQQYFLSLPLSINVTRLP